MRTFWLSAVFTVLFSLTAFATPPSVVLVQYHLLNNLLTVTRGVGKTQTIELKNLDVRKNFAPNAEQLHTLFSGLYAEGYELRNSSEIGSPARNTQIVTYVFVKP
ncbi:MAG TPA: hypothetical protein VF630_06120 [Hymenobacter sp.]|jgi:hypothetical protein